ncbi:MAG TPA: hypothetical protein VHK06_04495 [Candidatus Limnocylindria bacterium]|nr:hypothetical protein [Candidatus Limnocylindria bacterium]
MPWHPFLLTTAFLVNPLLVSGVEPVVGARAFGVALVGMAGLLAVGRVITGSWQRAGLAATAVGALLATKSWILPLAIALPRAHVLAAAVICAAALAAVYLAGRLVRRSLQRRGGDARATSALNVFCAILLALVVSGGSSALGRARAAHVPPQAVAPPRASGPDIYILLMDGYPRADVLRDTWGYDNSPFLSALEQRGFSIAQASRANYLTTRLTFASMLNMRHAHRLAGYRAIQEGAPTQPTLQHMIRNNLVLSQLRAADYRVTATAPGIEVVSLRAVDRWEEGPQLNEFEYRVLETTWAADLLRLFAPDYLASEHRARVRYGFDVIRRAAATYGRDGTSDLVWAHIPSPHMPPVFGPEGAPIPVSHRADFFDDSGAGRDVDSPEFAEAFRGNVTYLNALILEAIDAILASSTPQPVVIVMSDHGTGREMNYDDMRRTDIRSRAGTLFAALTPSRPGLFGDEITPVNVFAILFNAYLGTHHPLSPNTTYIATPGGLQPAVPDEGGDVE